MKNFLLLLGLVSIGLASDSPVERAPSSRFRLLAAPVTIMTDKVSLQANFVFRIDTSTGRTWIFREMTFGDKLTEGWSEVQELAPTNHTTYEH